jgi:hypothetical protein
MPLAVGWKPGLITGSFVLQFLYYALLTKPNPFYNIIDFYITGAILQQTQNKWSQSDFALREKFGGGNFGVVYEGLRVKVGGVVFVACNVRNDMGNLGMNVRLTMPTCAYHLPDMLSILFLKFTFFPRKTACHYVHVHLLTCHSVRVHHLT